MKISEVCNKTGLTKRAIRFYTEKGLLTPAAIKKERREYYEYSKDDIRLLTAISTLRRLDISVDDIRRLIAQPETVSEVVEFYREKSANENEENKSIAGIFANIDINECTDIFSLAQNAEKAGQLSKLPQRDIVPDFSKFEELTEEEKNSSYMKFHDKLLVKNYEKSKIEKFLKPVIALLIIAAVSFLIFFLYKARIMTVSYSGEAYVIDKSANTLQVAEISVSAKAYVDWEDFEWSDLKLQRELYRYLSGELIITTDEKEYRIELHWYDSDMSMGVREDVLAIATSMTAAEYYEIFEPGWEFEVPENLQDIGVDWEKIYIENYGSAYVPICIAIDLKHNRAFITDYNPWLLDEAYHIFD